MAQYLAEELLDSEGEPVIVKKARAVKKRPAPKSNKKVKHDIVPGPANDTDGSNDGDFLYGSSESDSPSENEPLTNAEVCSFTICL
jgi:hypothetical protein